MKNVAIVLFLLLVGCAPSGTKTIKLKLIETSDVHGNYFPYDFINQRNSEGGLARVACYVDSLRAVYGDNLLLLDNGDILQGQPSAYYYNYIDTASVHVAADIMNSMRFDVGNVGNHDLETGHDVYDRWIKQCNFPVLGANIVKQSDGEPYLQPYAVFEREGIKIVVLGLITPAIPAWLHEELWAGLYFEDMVEAAEKWMKIIQEKENPDIVIGLFHAGKDARLLLDRYREDTSVEIARDIPGFDVVLIGHDHTLYCDKVVNTEGDSVLVVNPGHNALFVSDVGITLTVKNKKVIDKQVSGCLTNVESYPACDDFVNAYQTQYNDINAYVNEKIGVFTQSVNTRAAYFGPSGFVDFIHSLQLELTNADISFASPLSFDASISKGDITIADMFNLYKFENYLYTMEATGEEVKRILEESYAIWTNQMKSPNDRLLLLRTEGPRRRFFANYYFLFDSAAGLIYTVDVTKPMGEKITIVSMADGTPFHKDKKYKIVVTSYRGNGGGELLIRALRISQEQLRDRILSATENDFRYYLIDYIREKKVLTPRALNQWKFIPENWVKQAAARDYAYLFGEDD
ncbi:bifunctional metallophosphatase/5'-nucleotidase [Parabacteroides sp. OttesenSCG-928-G07]|nr:bifunctional metallophosphatase/5'-nucleotidase [Parabacteroides sp. OttesenSCG-928-G21]MDL2278050.1 bifunctional metallophosphatase/5'-nucleotidase [Parabacteroides sp. OttesenSCG-928-G07]